MLKLAQINVNGVGGDLRQAEFRKSVAEAAADVILLQDWSKAKELKDLVLPQYRLFFDGSGSAAVAVRDHLKVTGVCVEETEGHESLVLVRLWLERGGSVVLPTSAQGGRQPI